MSLNKLYKNLKAAVRRAWLHVRRGLGNPRRRPYAVVPVKVERTNAAITREGEI
ncbi:MAG: hypothetical protein GVY30_12370 [Chloroflexi bacterium]|jgi:hypothetical protein|nr:hypothetical protein [Chloroflexota bacterium]